MLRFSLICDQPAQIRALTGLPAHEFMLLSHIFDRMFVRAMQTETLDGYVREGRSYSTYSNSPLPTSDDKLLFMLTYMKQNPTQAVHGQLFSMTQSNVSKWYHIILAILQRAMDAQDFLPARTCDELMDMLRESDTSVIPMSDDLQAQDCATTNAPVPFFIMMAPNAP